MVLFCFVFSWLWTTIVPADGIRVAGGVPTWYLVLIVKTAYGWGQSGWGASGGSYIGTWLLRRANFIY